LIPKSSQRSNGKQLAAHLISSENEQVTFIQSNGVYSLNIAGAISEMEAFAKISSAQKPLYHVSISPEQSANMSADDWKKTWALHDKIHGLDGLQFVEVQHEKNDRTHRHRVYNRVDPETGTARNLSWTRIKNERIARQLEVELGHTIIPGKHNRAVLTAIEKDGLTDVAEQLKHLAASAPAMPDFTHEEWQLAKRGAPIENVRVALAECWRNSDNAKSFEAALADKGFAIAQGDKVPVVVGLDGQEIPLLRAINVARKKVGDKALKKSDLANRLPEKLPDIDQVREAQNEILQQPGQVTVEKTDMSAQTQHIDDLAEMAQLAPAGKAEKAIKAKNKPDEDKPDWQRFREKMLYNQYGPGLEGSDLAKYWKVERGQDGQIRFSNKAGEVIDRGEILDVNAKHRNIEKAAAAAVAIAKAKGWDEVRASGSDAFKEAIFKISKGQGIAVALDSEHDRELWKKLDNEGQDKGDELKTGDKETQGVDLKSVEEKIKEETGKDVEIKSGATASNIAHTKDEHPESPTHGQSKGLK
jgi:hypothetical protein